MLPLKVGKKNLEGAAIRREHVNEDDEGKMAKATASGPHSPLQSHANIPKFIGVPVNISPFTLLRGRD